MLTTSVERLEGVTVKLTVTVSSDEVDAAIDRAYRAVSAKVKVPGFRPGKAPRPILDSMLGHEYIMSEASEDVVNSTYPRALDIESLRPIDPPEMEELDLVSPGTDFTYSAELDVRPELTLSGSEGLTIALPPKEATDAEIDVQIEVTRERFATLEPVEDRPAAEDDFVLISFVGTVEGEPYEGNEVDKYLYEMGKGLMPPEFDAGIIGLSPGDETTVEFTIPESTSNPEFAGKQASFAISLHEVKAKVLPEVDDEFASSVGGFDTVAQMREDIGTRIGVQKAMAHDRLKEQRARAAVAERLEGDVPEAMIVQRQSSMTRDFMTMLDERGLVIDQYLAQAGVDMDTFEADVRVQALQSVREDLALEALFRHVPLEVTDEDIDAELAEVGKATETTAEEARRKWEEMGLIAVLREQVMHRKAVMWLLDNIEITEEAATDEEVSQ